MFTSVRSSNLTSRMIVYFAALPSTRRLRTTSRQQKDVKPAIKHFLLVYKLGRGALLYEISRTRDGTVLRLLACIAHTESKQSMFTNLHGVPTFSPRSMDLALDFNIGFYETRC
jgi:hypothetical protein